MFVKAQQVIVVRDSNSLTYKTYKEHVYKYNSYINKKKEAQKNYRNQHYNKEDNVWEYSNGCFCKGVEYTVPVESKPINQVVYVPQCPVVKNTTEIKWKYKTDTVKVVVHDTVYLEKKESVVNTDENKHSTLVRFTSLDKQVKLNEKPYVEKRLYDYQGKYVGTVKLDPITLNPLE